MANLDTKSHDQLVSLAAMQMQSRTDKLLDFSIGAIFRAFAEAVAAVALWLQGLILRVLAATRASTSTGSDLDTWVGDWGMTRLGAQSAAGTVTFLRATPSAQALVPVGTIVETEDAAQRFQVVAAPSNPAYNSGLNGYVIPAGIGAIDVPVASTTTGASANVGAGTINRIIGGLTYVDAVSNQAAFTGGANAETDEALRRRFVLFVAQLAKATRAAVAYAILSLRVNLQYTITEFYTVDGAWRPAYFYVVVDDGTGAASDGLVSEVHAAIEAVRAAGIMFDVVKPIVVPLSITCTLTVAPGYDANTVKANVGVALRTWVNAIGLGNPLPYTAVSKIAYEASAGVLNVTGITVNGGTADITCSPRQVVKPNVITVN